MLLPDPHDFLWCHRSQNELKSREDCVFNVLVPLLCFNSWAFLELESNKSYADDIQAYAAGALEAHLTRGLIQMQWNNMYARYCDNQGAFCEKVRGFLSANMLYSRRQELKHGNVDPYWHMVSLLRFALLPKRLNVFLYGMLRNLIRE